MGRNIENETVLSVKQSGFRSFARKNRNPLVGLAAATGVAVGTIFLGACNNSTEVSQPPTPTGIEATQPPKPLFDFPPPSGKSCFDTIQDVYRHFNSDGYLVVDDGKYIIYAPASFSGGVMLAILIDGTSEHKVMSDEEFKREAHLVGEKLKAWFEGSGVNPDEVWAGIGQGYLRRDSIYPSKMSPYQLPGTTETSIGSQSGKCLLRPDKK